MSDGRMLELLETTENPFAWEIDSPNETSEKLKCIRRLRDTEERMSGHYELPRFCHKIKMAYLYATSDNLKEAESLLDECENILSTDDSLIKTYQPAIEHVLNATKAHVALRSNNTEKALKLVEMICCANAMEQQQQAALLAIRGLTLSCVSNEGRVKGLEYFKKAMKLNSREPEWCQIFGYLSLKVRYFQFPPTPPSPEEIILLDSNVRRNPSASTSLFLAKAYLSLAEHFFFNKEQLRSEEYRLKAVDIFLETIKLNKDDDPYVAILCAKGMMNAGKEFRKIVFDLMKKALKEAPKDPKVNYWSGLISKKFKQFEDARKYLRTSLDGGHIPAGFSLAHVESTLDPQFPAEGLYQHMLDKFSFNSGEQATIYFEKTLYLLFKKRDFIAAIKSLTKAIELGTNPSKLRVCWPQWIIFDKNVNLLELFINDIQYCLRQKVSNYSPDNLEAMGTLLGLLKRIAPETDTNATPTRSMLATLFEYDASKRNRVAR